MNKFLIIIFIFLLSLNCKYEFIGEDNEKYEIERNEVSKVTDEKIKLIYSKIIEEYNSICSDIDCSYDFFQGTVVCHPCTGRRRYRKYIEYKYLYQRFYRIKAGYIIKEKPREIMDYNYLESTPCNC